MQRVREFTTLGVVAVAVLASAAPLGAAGFSIFEQGTKAMGMAGAFTAQADDGSAMYHNVGGLAFLKEHQLQAGITYITQTKADFTGADPFPGAGVTEELKPLSAFPPHAYWVKPLNDRYTFGLAVNAPFGLVTEWERKDTFTGRFVSTKAELTVVDINPNIGIKLSDNFGLGIGAIFRLTEVELNRRAPAINPFTAQPVDVASVVLASDMETAVGWQVGFLHKVNNSFSWGASYRPGFEVDYGGDATFTQISTGNPQLDAVVGTILPFDTPLPITTGIDFPDQISVGVAVALNPSWLVELDVNETSWSSFDLVTIDFTTADDFDQELPQNWDDANHYRLGFRYTASANTEWRFGYVYDETPQPAEGVGPLLPDSSRNGVTVGYGRVGAKRSWDFALMYLSFNDRSTSTNRDNYNGLYEITGLLLGVTVGL